MRLVLQAMKVKSRRRWSETAGNRCSFARDHNLTPCQVAFRRTNQGDMSPAVESLEDAVCMSG